MTQFELDFLKENGYKPETGPPKEPKTDEKKKNGKDKFGNTTVQRRSSTNAWNKGLDFARSRKSSIDKPLFQPLLEEKTGIPNDIAAAVVEWSRNGGYVSVATWRKLRRLGINVPLSRRADKKPKGPTQPYGGGDAAGGNNN